MRDFRINGGFAKRKHVFWGVKWGILKEIRRDFRLNGGVSKIKRMIFGLNVGFAKRKRDFCFNVVLAKRKRVIFAYMGDLQIEKA